MTVAVRVSESNIVVMKQGLQQPLWTELLLAYGRAVGLGCTAQKSGTVRFWKPGSVNVSASGTVWVQVQQFSSFALKFRGRKGVWCWDCWRLCQGDLRCGIAAFRAQS